MGGEPCGKSGVPSSGEEGHEETQTGAEGKAEIKPERLKRSLPRMLTGLFFLALFVVTLLIFCLLYTSFGCRQGTDGGWPIAGTDTLADDGADHHAAGGKEHPADLCQRVHCFGEGNCRRRLHRD